MRRDVSKGSVLTFDDVQRPTGLLAETLWCEQNALWLKVVNGTSPGNLRASPHEADGASVAGFETGRTCLIIHFGRAVAYFTGHTGFKGLARCGWKNAWQRGWLRADPPTQPSLFDWQEFDAHSAPFAETFATLGSENGSR
jgi:hypothetical protein